MELVYRSPSDHSVDWMIEWCVAILNQGGVVLQSKLISVSFDLRVEARLHTIYHAEYIVVGRA